MKPYVRIDERMNNVKTAKNETAVYFYKGEAEKTSKMKFGSGRMKINNHNDIMSLEYQGQFFDDVIEGIGKLTAFVKTWQG